MQTNLQNHPQQWYQRPQHLEQHVSVLFSQFTDWVQHQCKQGWRKTYNLPQWSGVLHNCKQITKVPVFYRSPLTFDWKIKFQLQTKHLVVQKHLQNGPQQWYQQPHRLDSHVSGLVAWSTDWLHQGCKQGWPKTDELPQWFGLLRYGKKFKNAWYLGSNLLPFLGIYFLFRCDSITCIFLFWVWGK